jgi:hypothetical protein
MELEEEELRQLDKICMKRLILFILALFLSIEIASALDNYTPSTERHCNTETGLCTTSIYANTKYVYEDNTWKPIEQARSLLSVWSPEYLKIDPKYNITLTDVNLTSISLCININPSEVGKQIPFKRCSISTGECTSFLVLFNQPIDKCYNLTLNPLGYNYTFGGNSTTIKINNGGGLLEDLWLTDTIGGDDAEASMLKFNITAIPAGQTIMNATFCGYINVTLAADSTLATGVKVDTTLSEWVEATAAATLTGFAYVNSTTQVFTSITKSTWTCTDVTLQLNTSYRLGQQNATFRFQPTARTFTNIDVRTDNSGLRIGDTDDYISINDRENTLASGNYPYINVTYRSDFTAPTFTSNGTNMTTLSNVNGTWVKLFVNWTDNVKLNYTWIGSNFSGVWINETPVARAGLTTINHTNSTMITSGNNKNICWQSWANDTDNNINTTGLYCYDIYKYGMLQVNITSPVNNTNVTQNTSFYLNATVTCVGTDAICGVVSAYARYNGSGGSPDTNISFPSNTLIQCSGFFPLADTHVGSFSPDLVYHNSINLDVISSSGNVGNRRTWLIFNLNINSTGTITNIINVTLAIYRYGTGYNYPTGRTYELYNSSTSWNENSLTWNTQPSPITLQSTSIMSSGAMWEYWNISNNSISRFINGNNISYVIKDSVESSTTIYDSLFKTRENNSYSPNITICYSNTTIINNPIISSTSLLSSQSFNVSWLINATGTNNTQYLVDVLFNSSLGNSLVPDNSTDDMKVCIGSCPSAPSGAPTYTSTGINVTTYLNNTWAKLFVNWTDDVMLNYTWIGSNFSGAWINETPVARAGLTSYNHTNDTLISAGYSKNICWASYANDTAGNLGSTGMMCYTTNEETGLAAIKKNVFSSIRTIPIVGGNRWLIKTS